MKAYCKLCPVFQSLTTSTLLMGPNRENMIYRSLYWVIGFSLHTKSIFYGGFTLASGSSPIIYNVIACFLAFYFLVASKISFSDEYFYNISKCYIAYKRSESFSMTGLWGIFNKGGSSNGSSNTKVCRILIFIWGLFF